MALKNYTFGLDVVVFVGQQRFGEHHSLGEIHEALHKRGVAISERRGTDYMGAYEVLLKCAQGTKLETYREQFLANGGVVLAIDRVQPEKGKPTLYIFRDVLSGVRLHAVSLMHNDTESLKAEMKIVAQLLKKLPVSVQGVISDDQAALREGVAEVWPGVLHHLYHLHFLKAVQKPLRTRDSSLAKELKKRGVAAVSRNVKPRHCSLKLQSQR